MEFIIHYTPNDPIESLLGVRGAPLAKLTTISALNSQRCAGGSRRFNDSVCGISTSPSSGAWPEEGKGGACIRLQPGLPCIGGQQPLATALRLLAEPAPKKGLRTIYVCGTVEEAASLGPQHSGLKLSSGCGAQGYRQRGRLTLKGSLGVTLSEFNGHIEIREGTEG